MARYAAVFTTVTCAALADTTNTTDATYPGSLRCGASVGFRLNEVSISGEDTSSTVGTLILARTSTISTGALSVGNLALMDSNSTAPGTTVAFGNTIATTKAQRSSTLYLLGTSLNSFGGIYRWQARFGEEIACYNNSATGGEVLLSAKTGTPKVSGHLIAEVI